MIFLVALARLEDNIETLQRSQGLGLNIGLHMVQFSKALTELLHESNPNPYDIPNVPLYYLALIL